MNTFSRFLLFRMKCYLRGLFISLLTHSMTLLFQCVNELIYLLSSEIRKEYRKN